MPLTEGQQWGLRAAEFLGYLIAIFVVIRLITKDLFRRIFVLEVKVDKMEATERDNPARSIADCRSRMQSCPSTTHIQGLTDWMKRIEDKVDKSPTKDEIGLLIVTFEKLEDRLEKVIDREIAELIADRRSGEDRRKGLETDEK